MATRPAGARRPTTPSRPWAGVQPVYQDFRPMSRWQEDGESDILLIYLPGFIRQHLKVSTEGTNVVRAKGERLDAGNKWSQFQEDYQVPERGNIRAVRARFEGGILTITIPWKEQTRESSKQATVVPAIPPYEVPPKTLSSPDAQKQSMIPLTELKESTVPQKGFHETPAKEQLMSSPQEGKESTTQRGFDDIPLEVVTPQKLMSPPRETKASIPQKGFDDIPPKVAFPPKLMSPPREPKESKPQKRFDDIPPNVVSPPKLVSPPKEQKEYMPQKGIHDIPPRVLTPPPLTPVSSGKGMDDQKTVIRERIIITPSRDEQKDRLADPSNITTPTTTIINHKERSVKGGEAKAKSTKLESLERSKGGAGTDDKMPEEKSKGLAGQTRAENAAAEMNDERQLLANVGVAVLVIVALGTYIFTYTIPSGEPN